MLILLQHRERERLYPMRSREKDEAVVGISINGFGRDGYARALRRLIALCPLGKWNVHVLFTQTRERRLPLIMARVRGLSATLKRFPGILWPTVHDGLPDRAGVGPPT